MSIYVAMIIGFVIGMSLSYLVHWWVGASLKEMVEISSELADEAREYSEASDRIQSDMDRRFADLQRAKRSLEEQYGLGAVERALRDG